MSSSTALEAFLAEPRNIIVAAIRKDGRPHLSPNWFLWDGANFYVSTTRTRAKYHNFRRDPRAELIVDDATGFRYAMVPATVEIREDVLASVPVVRAIRAKHGRPSPDEDQLIKDLTKEGRVLLVFTPTAPPSAWTTTGLD